MVFQLPAIFAGLAIPVNGQAPPPPPPPQPAQDGGQDEGQQLPVGDNGEDMPIDPEILGDHQANPPGQLQPFVNDQPNTTLRQWAEEQARLANLSVDQVQTVSGVFPFVSQTTVNLFAEMIMPFVVTVHQNDDTSVCGLVQAREFFLDQHGHGLDQDHRVQGEHQDLNGAQRS